VSDKVLAGYIQKERKGSKAFVPGKRMKNREVFKCEEEKCPGLKGSDFKHWICSEAIFHDQGKGNYLSRLEMCLGCKVFWANIDISAMKHVVKKINIQFGELRKVVRERDKELEGMSLELALGLSEVFEALKRISMGDPSVRIREGSKVELIGKLKQIINITARNIGEIVYQSHEFAMGLAEHFDVLHRVSKGDLTAKVSGISKTELLKHLKLITNQMIKNISSEITMRKEAEAGLMKEKIFSDSVISSLPGLFYLFDEKGNFLRWNRNVEVVTGYSAKEISAMGALSFFSEEERGLVGQKIREIFEKGETMVEAHLVSKSGKKVPYLFSGMLFSADSHKFFAGTAIDITKLKRAENALRKLSFTDELTGLFNRRGFFSLAEQQLKIAYRMKKRDWLLYADLDGLKWINDNLGHNEGDIALIDLANILKDTFRKSDLVARIGGDEFVVLGMEKEEANAEILVSRLLENLMAHNKKGIRSYPLSLSMGIAYFDPENSCSIDELLARADKLMYLQKKKKKRTGKSPNN
jgi:diguanylate cyclase (GGDEF)-like protein/PAS domain S-box-containing protein